MCHGTKACTPSSSTHVAIAEYPRLFYERALSLQTVCDRCKNTQKEIFAVSLYHREQIETKRFL